MDTMKTAQKPKKGTKIIKEPNNNIDKKARKQQRKEKKKAKKLAPVDLKLDQSTWDSLTAINNEFENNFAPLMAQENNENQTFSVNTEEPKPAFHEEMQFLGVKKYLKKENTKLPIFKLKSKLIKIINKNQVTLIKAETGCGKSTQVPQFILNNWAENNKKQPLKIIITQPRRVAAISLAERVAKERKETCGTIVGSHVRFNANYDSKTTRILYCTSGILLRQIQANRSLPNVTHVIVDEVHERHADTDLVLNLLKDAIRLNPILKVIIMSATIDTNLIEEYFGKTATISVPGLCHPVKQHFAEKIKLNLSGTIANSTQTGYPNIKHSEVAALINYIHSNRKQGAILCFLPGWSDICNVNKLLLAKYKENKWKVLRLHSKLSDHEQRLVFAPPPKGKRKVILSTNLAETSLTIDDVVYVVDSGIHKDSCFEQHLGVTCLDSEWISQSSAIQRKGRAGRVRPGECFHLYTKAKFDSLPKFADPEIVRISLTKIALDALAFSESTIDEFMQKLPTPPPEDAIQKSIQDLKTLQLLTENENITPLGRILAHFQLEPRIALVLVNSFIFKCVSPMVDIVTLFASENDMFPNVFANRDLILEIKKKTERESSDHLSMMVIFEMWIELMQESDEESAIAFCEDHLLRHESLCTLSKLRDIHFLCLKRAFPTLRFSDDFSNNDELVKALLFGGLQNVAVKNKNIHGQKVKISRESMNFGKSSSNMLVYLKETRCCEQKINTIRETSAIAPLAILLFTKKKLIITHDNEVGYIGIEDSEVKFECPIEQCKQIQRCKTSLDSSYNYILSHMITNTKIPSETLRSWNIILHSIDGIFKEDCEE